MQRFIRFGARKIDFVLQCTTRRSLTIQVRPDGMVVVNAPNSFPEDKILEKVKLKAPWILKQQEYFSRFPVPLSPRRFVSGETHLYLGRQHKLKVVKATERMIKVYRGQLWVYSDDTSPTVVKAIIGSWQKERANAVFRELFEAWLPRIKRYWKETPRLVIRKMSGRWGSCTGKGSIILNLELIKASKSCIEYVIVHELCHLVHHNHTRQFFKLLEKLLPDWRKRKQRLEDRLA
ncbi:M48 family metallopeptidase [Chitinophaga cymbidii]|uniref:M48 family metallopeptidase n=1 Tax=Chitinophaga cymbidii TaxID=1096750 RepID=UPI0011BEA0AC|nr:SprT family zinc-dependent metalloprotease [Chitinophaga cymbidii]